MNDRPLGVFDSGLGGLTVLQAMADLLPDEHLIYLGDTARYPYGPRSAEELRRFSVEITEFLLEFDIKMLVVACNSATAAALDLLRERYEIPVIGVVEPGIRAALSTTHTGHVAVIGTEMTANSKVYESTSEALRTGLDLVVRACPGFVELVEAGDTDSDRAHQIVADQLAVLDDEPVDALVLGCTHYPLLARTIKDVVGRDVTLVSSADETAFEVKDILERTGMVREAEGPVQRTFYTTGDKRTFQRLGERFLGFPLEDVRVHSWD
ncbi:MAG: glutamate racemase [Nitriliruptorales bacterium]|nr:glutamate racemase [Nitriliruptorales bacterium]